MTPRRTIALLTALTALAAAPEVRAQPAPAPGAPPSPAAEPDKKPAPADPIGGLDDLLGIPKAPAVPPAEGPPPESDALDPSKQELERQLTAAEAQHQFKEAVREMGELADRLEKAGDVGVQTQRLHDDILRKLDVLIKRAKEGQGQGSSESQSSDSQNAQQQRQTPSQPKPAGQDQQAGEGENRGEAMPPAPKAAQLRGQLDTARAAWGALPERVRDSLLQGSNDYFSALYQSMTEAYYKKIAEEAKE